MVPCCICNGTGEQDWSVRGGTATMTSGVVFISPSQRKSRQSQSALSPRMSGS